MPRLFAVLLGLIVLLAPGYAMAQTVDSDDVIIFEPTPELRIFRSKHYRIHTTLSKQETVPYGRHMDAIYEQYQERFSSFKSKQIDPMPLYLFKTEQQYDRFLAEHDLDGAHSGGMFFVTHQLEGLATWTDARSRRRTFEVLQHEGFHQFAWHAIGPKLPVWLNEGLAQYFESAIITDGRMSLGITRTLKIEKMRNAIDAKENLPLNQLIRITGEQWAKTLRKTPDHSSLLYAQAWSVTYFLIHGQDGKNKTKLAEYLRRLSEGERADQAMLMAFGPGGLADLENDWRAYALKQHPNNVAQATERLEFLGTGLRLLAEQGEDMPQDLGELQDSLQRYGFKLRRREMGITRNLSAEHAELFQFSKDSNGDEQRDFVLLKSATTGLPPTITAPGLEPAPTLIWYRDADGKLVQDIAYR